MFLLITHAHTHLAARIGRGDALSVLCSRCPPALPAVSLSARHRRDLERYQTLAHEDFTWVGTCKYVFFPVHPMSMAPLGALSFADLVLHFQSNPEAAVLLWGAPQDLVDALTYDFCRPAFGALQQPQDVQTPLPVYGRALPRPHVMAGPGPAAVKPMQLREDEQRGFYSTYLDALPPAAQADLGFAPWRGCVVCWCCADESDGVR